MLINFPFDIIILKRVVFESNVGDIVFQIYVASWLFPQGEVTLCKVMDDGFGFREHSCTSPRGNFPSLLMH